jgi:hypothetical protein
MTPAQLLTVSATSPSAKPGSLWSLPQISLPGIQTHGV